jgi:hypothetical protein
VGARRGECRTLKVVHFNNVAIRESLGIVERHLVSVLCCSDCMVALFGLKLASGGNLCVDGQSSRRGAYRLSPTSLHLMGARRGGFGR